MALLPPLRPKARWTWALAGLAGLGLLTLAITGIWLGRESRRHWTVAELEQRIQAELSPTCERHEVEAWFDRHGIPHRYSTDTTEDRYAGFTMPEVAGLGHRSLSGMVRGTLQQPGASTGGFIDVYFFFDLRGSCAGYLVFPFAYPP